MAKAQKEAALSLFRNIERKAKLLADAIYVGDCDDIEIDNDLAGDMLHTEHCVNALYSVFIERKTRGKKWPRL